MGRVKSIGFHQHVMRRRQKVTMMGIAGGTEKRPQRLRNQLGACHDLAVLTSLTAPRGEAFVKKWGVLRIFIGRFFDPRELEPKCGNKQRGSPGFRGAARATLATPRHSLGSRSWPAIILCHRRIISR
jgi:hypothetical protein